MKTINIKDYVILISALLYEYVSIYLTYRHVQLFMPVTVLGFIDHRFIVHICIITLFVK